MKNIFIANIYCSFRCNANYGWTYPTIPFQRWLSHFLSFSSCGVHVSADVRSLRINRLDYRALYFLNGLDDWRLCRTGGLVPETRWDQITIKTEKKLRRNRQGGSLNPPVQVSSDLISPCWVQLERRLIDASVRIGGVVIRNSAIDWRNLVLEFIRCQVNLCAKLIHVPWSLRLNYVLGTAQVWVLSSH